MLSCSGVWFNRRALVFLLKCNPWSRLGTDHSATGHHSMGSGDGLDGDADLGAHLSKPSVAAAAAADVAERNRMESAGVRH